METSRLPVLEVCERIIDLAGLQSAIDPDPAAYYPSMRACCLVCWSWYPRARYNLYNVVSVHHVSRPISHRLASLAMATTRDPHVAESIVDLRISSGASSPSEPFVIAVGPSKWTQGLVSLKTLVLRGFTWYYPRMYNSIIAEQYSAVVYLHLCDTQFDSMQALSALMWGLQRVQEISLENVSVVRTVTDEEAKTIKARSLAGVCQHLRVLHISDPMPSAPEMPVGSFGYAVEEVKLEYHWPLSRQTSWAEYMVTLPQLRSLQITVRIGAPEPLVIANAGVQRNVLLSVLSLTASPYLSVISVAILPYDIDKHGYGMGTRAELLHLLHDDDGLSPEGALAENLRYCYPALLKLRITITDFGWFHGEAWWGHELMLRLALPDEFTQSVAVDVCIKPFQSAQRRFLWTDPMHSKVAILLGTLAETKRDTAIIKQLLTTSYGYIEENVILMDKHRHGLDPKHLIPTRTNVVNVLQRIVSLAKAGDTIVFFFSGYASHTIDDESLSYIDLADPGRYKRGVFEVERLFGYELQDLLYPLPEDVRLYAIFDAPNCETLLGLEHRSCNDVYIPWECDTYHISVRPGPIQGPTATYACVSLQPRRRNALDSPAMLFADPPTSGSVENDSETETKGVAESEFPDYSLRRLPRDHHDACCAPRQNKGADPLKSSSMPEMLRCTSPLPMPEWRCDGFCARSPSSYTRNFMLSLSASHEPVRLWTSRTSPGYFSRALADVLGRSPRVPIRSVLFELAEAARTYHDQEVKPFVRWVVNGGTKGESVHFELPRPQLSAHHPVDMDGFFDL